MRKQKYLALTMLLLVASAQLAYAQESTIIPESSTTVADAADTVYPSDVENVKAVGGDKMITLTWTAATDNTGVKGYKIFYGNTSVAADTASYTLGPVDAGNVTTYELKNLENGKPYYFAVTAYDNAGNESEYYSTETSATPGSAAVTTTSTDKTAPKVLSAAAVYDNSVKVVFSEGVKLPLVKPETAFSVKADLVGTILPVINAVVDPTDASGKTVMITTAQQKKATKYVLTVGIQLQDLAGNPMVSGTSDTAVFNGTDALSPADIKPVAETPVADTKAPAFVTVKGIDGNTVQVTFSEPVVLLTNAVENFIVTDANDNTKITNVKKVTINAGGTMVTLSTDNLEAKKYNLIALKVKDAAGNLMPVESSATTFDGVAAVVTTPDTTTPDTTIVKPEDAATNLVAKAMASLIVNLSWNTKADKMADVANFVMYMSTDKGVTYDKGIVLSKDAKMYDFNNLKADMVYYFKLTTRDSKGNESEGLVTFMTLPATGPEVLFLLFGSAGVSALVNRKKKAVK